MVLQNTQTTACLRCAQRIVMVLKALGPGSPSGISVAYLSSSYTLFPNWIITWPWPTYSLAIWCHSFIQSYYCMAHLHYMAIALATLVIVISDNIEYCITRHWMKQTTILSWIFGITPLVINNNIILLSNSKTMFSFVVMHFNTLKKQKW